MSGFYTSKAKDKTKKLEKIKNNYNIVVNFVKTEKGKSPIQPKIKIEGSAIFDFVSMGLTAASYLFSFDGTNAETIANGMSRAFPFLSRRTNGYDFLISISNRVFDSIERGFKTKETHSYEIKTMIAGSENHDKYIFLEHDGSEISTNKLIIMCNVAGILILAFLYLYLRQKNKNEILELKLKHVDELLQLQNNPSNRIAYREPEQQNNTVALREQDQQPDQENEPEQQEPNIDQPVARRPAPKRTSSARPPPKRRGRGFVSDFVDSYVDKFYMPNTVNMMKEFGNMEIVDSFISRSIIKPRFLNYINKITKILPYDDLYHLKICFVLSDGTVLQVEKVPHIAIRYYTESDDEEQINTNFNGLTINEILQNTREYMGDKKYFTYNSVKENCQDFVLSLCIANGDIDEEIEEFVLQEFDLTKIDKRLIVAAKTITDLKKIYDMLFTGGNKKIK